MAQKTVILIIEDDREIQELLEFSLAKEGWRLVQAKTGEQGLDYVKKNPPSCILLDIMLPGIDGLSVLKKLKGREESRNIPVIMTTARSGEADIVSGLELGAADYVVKPYSPRVLAARIRAALRREEDSSRAEMPSVWQQGPLRLDAVRHEVFYGDTPILLQATEFSLLRHFMSHPGQVFSRNQIIAAIRGDDYPVTDRSVDVQILGLRKKLKEAGDLVETIRGVGYRFADPAKGAAE